MDLFNKIQQLFPETTLLEHTSDGLVFSINFANPPHTKYYKIYNGIIVWAPSIDKFNYIYEYEKEIVFKYDFDVHSRAVLAGYNKIIIDKKEYLGATAFNKHSLFHLDTENLSYDYSEYSGVLHTTNMARVDHVDSILDCELRRLESQFYVENMQ
jgi:hypothetical protein